MALNEIPDYLPHKNESYRRRWLAKVRVPRDRDKCWTWTGASLPSNGGGKRGRFSMYGHTLVAYRAGYILFKGPIPEGQDLLHSCGNGHKLCVNPDHVNPGTPTDNRRDERIHQLEQELARRDRRIRHLERKLATPPTS